MSLLALTKKLVAIPSHAANPTALQQVLEVALSELKGFTIEHFFHNGVPSALIYVGHKRPPKFKILLNGHLDVVAGKEHQYTPRLKGNRLYGAGVMDMKANVACLITAFKSIARTVSYPLGLQLVTDEEVGGFDGTKWQIDCGVRTEFVLAGEPTNFEIVHKAKGVLLLKISATGKTAHGAYPWRGDNAIWSMHKFLAALQKKYPVPTEQKWISTVNVSSIGTSNQAFNKIPDDCEVKLDIRFIQEDTNTIVRTIKNILPPNLNLEIIMNEPALHTDAHNPFITTLAKITHQITAQPTILRGANGTSDARHFARVYGAGIEFGPIGGNIGADDEWVDVASLKTYCDILTLYLQIL